MKIETHKRVYYSYDQANGDVNMLDRVEHRSHYVKTHAIRSCLTGEVTGHKYTIHHRRKSV